MPGPLKLGVTMLFRVVGVLAALYVLVSVLAWKYQERLAFPGPRNQLPSPRDFNIHDGDTVTVTTSDGVALRGWYLPPNPAPAKGAKAPGLIWFYGNMETIRSMGAIIRDFRPPGTGLLVLDYRGYGESGGSPTEAGVYLDAEAAWTFITTRPEIDGARIGVYGRSIGSVPALFLGQRRPVRAVVLDSPFTNALDMVKEHYAWMPRFLVNLSLDNLTRAKAINVPLLIYHGSDDRLAPLSMGVRIAQAGGGDLVVLRGAGHNDTYDVGGLSYRDRVRAFLAETLASKP